MTGPEHYAAAQKFLEHSKNHTDTGSDADAEIARLAAAQAQVHATLALAAANVAPYHSTQPTADWAEALS